MTDKRLTEINEIMDIGYELNNLKCHLFEQLDLIDDDEQYKNTVDYLMALQEQINKLLSKSRDLYNKLLWKL